MGMAVRRWAVVIAFTLPLAALPLFGQQASSSQQQEQSAQPTKSTDQELPSAPQPQPTAGKKKPQSQKQTAPPPAPTPSPQNSEPGPYGPEGPTDTQPPRSTPPPNASGSSSSSEDKIDITPPANDAKEHPNAGDLDDSVGEFHPFDPHRAAKDVEVGDFYFKRHNYRAAISRYREALLYKPNDAIATYSLAEALEKAGDLPEAVKNYLAYLKILPYGPSAKDAHTALHRLKAAGPAKANSAAK
jgi:tetratricopeptide (TPR) repeat protein